MLVTFKRIIKNGWKSFFRNFTLNTATVFIMTIVVSSVTFLFLFNSASNILISDIQQKVDISVYLREDAIEDDILRFKSVVLKIPEVKDVDYVSKEQALEEFIEKHRDDPILMESIREVGRNPFLASLSIRTWLPSQYAQITKFLEEDSFKNMIEKVDYYKRKPIIERIFSITNAINRTGIFSALILGLIALLVGFNTIKIAISNASEEISVQRLVGASNWFIRGPFLIQGIIVGLLAILITLILAFGLSYGLDSSIKAIAPEISMLNLFLSNFFVILLIQLAVGIGLGVISSLVAVRKYLKV